jgi:conjugative transposon TraM protein
MKKLNLKQPKYIFPLVILLPIVFLAYEISKFTDSSDEPQKGVVTDNINMSLPDARNEGVGSKLDEMNKHFSEDGAYTAIGALGDDKEAADSTMSGYSESELNDIDAENAKRMRKQKEQEDLERSLAEARKHINSYGFDDGGSYGSRSGRASASRGGRQSDMEDYARELEEIQQRSLERQKVLERTFGGADEEKERKAEEERKRLAEERKKKEVKPELVMKAEDKNAGMFNTINEQQEADAPLIKAMIDKTTKAHEGTRLRFKLLDDVIIKDVRLKKGTYLYGIVTGFGQQRVMASISSILVGDKFIKVSLSVFDNDGMEGFYVPESAFRDMMKDAGAQAMQSNISFDGGYGGGLSGEAVALQALQNMYQSASTAISGNIRKNKARIKYNTIVYLINKDAVNQ